ATVRLKPVPPGTPRTFRASFDDIAAAGDAVTAIVNGKAQPEVLELLDAHSVRTIEKIYPSGLVVPNAAVLIGQTVGADAAADAQTIIETCSNHSAVDEALAEAASWLEARRLASRAWPASALRVSCDVGVPVGEPANMFRGIDELAQHLARAISIVAHAGDGNLLPTVQADDTPEE